MSVAEDTELRDLVTQTLEKKGILAKIKAELRASVFLALEEQSSELKQPFVNNTFNEYLATSDSALSLCLVHEFLEYLELDNTLAVFSTETHHGRDYEYKGRDVLMKDLHLEKSNDKKCPLLTLLLQSVREATRSPSSPTQLIEGQASVLDANAIVSTKTAVPSNISCDESSISSLDRSVNPFNQTFTTGALVTSFGSPDSSLEKGATEINYQNFQNKNPATSEKKSHSTLESIDPGSISMEAGDSLEHKQRGDVSDGSQQTKDKLVHTFSTNSQTSLSNLPPLTEHRPNKNQVGESKSLFYNALLGSDMQDNYEEDFSSESSGAGDKEEKDKSRRTDKKKEADLSKEHVSSKDIISPVPSISEELEGDTNSGTDDVLNSVASADTADSSLSYAGSKNADYMENL